MKGRFWRKALAVATSVLMLSGGVPIQPLSQVFEDIAITASAVGNTINIEANGQTISDTTTWTDCTVNITGSGTVTFSNRISISGNVTLNLGAGTTLTASKGIAVHEGNSLTIDGEGTLNAYTGYKEYYGAAIGGASEVNAGTIIINGGTVNAYGRYYAAAIGGGYNSNGGNIIINGGTVNADSETGKADGAGIGGGSEGDGGNITINGGNITAESYSGTGIGGGYKGNGGIINITGGNVTSTVVNNSAGIGGGCFGNAGTITITGGIINVTSGDVGAGIGGGGTISNDKPAGSGGTIAISGGQITVTSSGGYGIGAGKSYYNNNGAEGTISLSWTESTDFINASSYKGNISFEDGKRFYYDGTTDYVTADELANRLNQKIVPAVANNNSLAFADIQMPRYYITTNGTAVDVSYDVYDYNGSKLTEGTHYTAVIKNSSNEEVSSFDQLGDYTLTVTGTGTTYTGSKSFTFSLVEWDENLSVDGSDHYINFPSDGTKKTVYLGKDQTIKVYDSEGKDGNLVPSDGLLMLCAPEGYTLEVTGKTDAQFYASGQYWNLLKAYDGNDETETALITTIEQNSDNILFASSADSMLMRFYAIYGSTEKYGLDLTVRVVENTSHNITVGTADNGSIASDKTSAKTNETVTLTVTPASGYLLKRIIVTYTDNSTTIATIGEDHWYSGVNTVTLRMPNRNVTVTPEFANVLTIDDGLTLTIDPARTTEYVIPEGVQSFNIKGSANNSSTVTAILKAPEGVRLLATIDNCEIYNSYGYISVYDGTGSSSTLIKQLTTHDASISSQTSTAEYMTFEIYGLASTRLNGKIEMVYSINYDLAGGSVATENPATYTYDTDTFTLTNPTREGYEFAGWSGTDLDAANTSVTIAKGSYRNRSYTATWKKPLTNSDITVETIADQTYTGNSITPNVTVKDGETDITDQCDIAITNNTNVGTADVTITAKPTSSEYSGSTSTTFGIVYSDGIGERLAGYSLSLDGDIGVNFYMELDQSVIEDTGAYMHFTLPDGSTSDVYLTDTDNCRTDTTTFPGKTYYVFKCNVAAKEMTDTITAQMFSGGKSGQGYEYTVKEYADYLLDNTDKNDDYAKAAPLVKAMLDYGAYSQTYFKHNTDALANGGKDSTNIQEVDADTINKPYDPKGTYLGDAGDTTFEGATLSLKSETTLSLYFKSSRDLSFECDSYEVEKNTTAGGYQIARIRGIKADDLDETFKLDINDVADSGNTQTFYGYVHYCPLTYCYNVLKGGSDDENLQNVCKALYLYWQAANEYSE